MVLYSLLKDLIFTKKNCCTYYYPLCHILASLLPNYNRSQKSIIAIFANFIPTLDLMLIYHFKLHMFWFKKKTFCNRFFNKIFFNSFTLVKWIKNYPKCKIMQNSIDKQIFFLHKINNMKSSRVWLTQCLEKECLTML